MVHEFQQSGCLFVSQCTGSHSARISVWYMIRNLRWTVTIDSVLANSNTQNAFLFTVNATLLEFMYHSRIVLSVGGSVRYMIRNLRCTVTIDPVLANSKTQNAFLFTANAIFLHDYPIAVESGSTPKPIVQKKTWRDSLPIDMLLSAVSVLVVAQSSSEFPEGLMNNPVCRYLTWV